MLSATPRETIYASDQVASDLEELTLTFDEGPCVDAFTGGPALVADLMASDCLALWPVFAPAAAQAGVRAVFALPLQVGSSPSPSRPWPLRRCMPPSRKRCW